MALRKLAAALISAGILGMQVLVMLPRNAWWDGWFWPFLDYPMYAAAFDAGASYTKYELRLIPCAPGAPPVEVEAGDLRMHRFGLRDLLIRAAADSVSAPEAGDSPSGLLERMILQLVPGAYCEARIEAQTFALGPHGLEERDPPRRVLRQLRLEPRPSEDGISPARSVP